MDPDSFAILSVKSTLVTANNTALLGTGVGTDTQALEHQDQCIV